MPTLSTARVAPEIAVLRFLAEKRLMGRRLGAPGLAKAAGLWLTESMDGACLVGDELRYDPRAPAQWRDAAITREVARWALRRYGGEDTPAAVSAATRALLQRPQSDAELGALVDHVG